MQLVLDSKALCTLADIGKVPELANQARQLRVMCHSVLDTEKIAPYIESVDPRFAGEAQGTIHIIPAMQNFTNVKWLNFQSHNYGTRCGSWNDSDEANSVDHYEIFFAVVAAAQYCGLRLDKISGLFLDLTRQGPDNLSEASVFRHNLSLSTLSELDVRFELPPTSPNTTIVEAQFGSRLAASLNSLQNLKILSISLGPWPAVLTLPPYLFDSLAGSLYLPKLSSLALVHVVHTSDTMLRFLKKHATTIRSLKDVRCRIFGELDESMVKQFFTGIRGLQLEHLTIELLMWHDCGIGFPGVDRLFHPEKSEGDCLDESVSLEGRSQVEEGIAAMLQCFTLEFEMESDSDLEEDEVEDEDGNEDGDGNGD